MAFIGLMNPYIARLVDEEKKKYMDCFMCGEAISVNVTPNYNEAKLHSNNRLSEYVKEFKDGNMVLGTNRLPIEASKVCFGHEVSEDNCEVTYKTNDSANYVGVGFYADEIINGKRQYVATVVYKVKFGEAADEYSTKGDNIDFKTPKIEGVIAGISNNEWKKTKIFNTESEADEWLQEFFEYKKSEAGDGSGNSSSSTIAAYKTRLIDK